MFINNFEWCDKFKKYIDWDEISRYQKLSEDFIREFEDYVDWYEIRHNQNLSEDFIKEFKYILNNE